MFRVYRVLRNSKGEIIHKTPVGRSGSMQGARALVAGTSGLVECIIVDMDNTEEKKMTVAEMRKEASNLGIKGIKGMKKAELEKALEKVKKVQKTANTGLKRVTMVAFTGMWLGEFDVVKETKKEITVMTKESGKLSFDRNTGIQINPRDKKFANRIQFCM